MASDNHDDPTPADGAREEESTPKPKPSHPKLKKLTLATLKTLVAGGVVLSADDNAFGHTNASSHAESTVLAARGQYIIDPSTQTFADQFDDNRVPAYLTPIGGAQLSVVGTDINVVISDDGEGVFFTSPFLGPDGLQDLQSIFVADELEQNPPGSRVTFTFYSEVDPNSGLPSVPILETTYSSTPTGAIDFAFRDLSPPNGKHRIRWESRPIPEAGGAKDQAWSTIGVVSPQVPASDPEPIPFSFTGFSVVGHGVSSFQLRALSGSTEDQEVSSSTPKSASVGMMVLLLGLGSLGVAMLARSLGRSPGEAGGDAS